MNQAFINTNTTSQTGAYAFRMPASKGIAKQKMPEGLFFTNIVMKTHQQPKFDPAQAQQQIKTEIKPEIAPKDDDGFGLDDLVDMVNPLQHIPVIGSVYRHVTGDKIQSFSRIAGGGIYGGVFGAAAAAFNVMLKSQTGEDVVGHAVAMLEGEQPAPAKSRYQAAKASYVDHSDNSRYNS